MSMPVTAALVALSILLIILLTSKWKLSAFISLFLVSLFLAVAAMPGRDVIGLMKEGFGSTLASVGFLIILGAIIAIILDKTGAALALARFLLARAGERNAVAALGLTGFIAGMTIFCDSGFIILSGLAKSFSRRTKVAMPLMAAFLGCSLYVVHCLVPTHPGALAAAAILDVNVGYLVLCGILFAIPGFVVAFFWVKRMTKGRHYLPAVVEGPEQEEEPAAPPVLLSFLPVAVPLILIATGSFLQIISGGRAGYVGRLFIFTGDPVMALAIGVAFALLLLRNKKMETLNAVFETAIEKAGPILVVTAAGGMFGLVIKETGIGASAGTALGATGLGVAVPFLITAVLKTAQGSSTVAIITAASMVAPMLSLLGLDTGAGRLLAMIAMGAGSMIFSHANDSYFWVVTRFSDIRANITLRVFSTATAVMGAVVFACAWLVSFLVL